MSHYAKQPGRSPLVWLAGYLVSKAWRTSQFCKLMAPKHSRGRSGTTRKVSELRKMSHYAKQPDC